MNNANHNALRFLMTLVLLFSIVACSPPNLNGGTAGERPYLPPSEIGPVRPDIPRTTGPQDMPDEPQYVLPIEQPSGGEPMPPVVATQTVDLDVRFGDAIGEDHAILTQREFPLLRHPTVRVNANSVVGYEERLLFDFRTNSTCIPEFTLDEETDEIGSFLRCEARKPILAYQLILDRGTWRDLEGKEIQLLGHTYVVADATNYSVGFFGKDIASNFFFQDGRALTVNSSRQHASICAVDPRSVSFELFADGEDDGGILLSPNETLSDNLDMNVAALFDLRYVGAPAQGSQLVTIKRSGDGYKLTTNTRATEISLIVADHGARVFLGREDRPLHLTPCSGTEYCVAPNTVMPFTTPDGLTAVLQYEGASGSRVRFSDGDKEYSYEYLGRPGVDAWTEVLVGRFTFRCRVGAKDNVTKQQNISCDQGFIDGRAQIVLADGSRVRIGDLAASTIPVDIIVPRSENQAEHTIHLALVHAGTWRTRVENVTLYEDEESDDLFGQTLYGTTVILKRSRDSTLPSDAGDEVTVMIPRTRAYGIVRLEE